MNCMDKDKIVDAFFTSKDVWDYLDKLQIIVGKPLSLMDLDQKDIMPDYRRNRDPELYQNMLMIKEIYVNGIHRAFISISLDLEKDPAEEIEAMADKLEFASHFIEKMPSFLDTVSLNNKDSFLKNVYDFLFLQNDSRGASRSLLNYEKTIGPDDNFVIINFREYKPANLMRQLEYTIRYNYKHDNDILLSHADTIVLIRKLDGLFFSAGDMEELDEIIKDFPVIASVSDSFKSLFKDRRIQYFYNCNNQLLSLLIKAQYRVTQIVLYDNWRYIFLMHDAVAMQSDYLEQGFKCPEYKYISEKIWAVLKADETNNTDVFSTLFYYLSTNMSLNRTADMMHIHKNTVVYRLKKLTEDFNFDFSNIDECFNLMLSCRLYKYSQDLRS